MSTPQRKVGDWDCPSCNYINFASKSECKCGTKRPLGSGHKGSEEVANGDWCWSCEKCGVNNHKSRRECFKCNEPRVHCSDW